MKLWTLYNNKARVADMQFSSPRTALVFMEGLAANFQKFNCLIEFERSPKQIQFCAIEKGTFSGNDEPNECTYTLVCQE